MSEELTDAICKVDGLRMASRTKLHVSFVVKGSVRKQCEQLKVIAQLIRTDDGYYIWSGSFERKLADVFAVQHEIAASVVKVLEVKVTETPDSIDRSEQILQQAIAVDPAYAPLVCRACRRER